MFLNIPHPSSRKWTARNKALSLLQPPNLLLVVSILSYQLETLTLHPLLSARDADFSPDCEKSPLIPNFSSPQNMMAFYPLAFYLLEPILFSFILVIF